MTYLATHTIATEIVRRRRISELSNLTDLESPLPEDLAGAKPLLTVSGASPADFTYYQQLRIKLEDVLAKEFSFPTPCPSRVAASAADPIIARVLHQELRITRGDACRDGVWEFLSVIVFPRVIKWRWLTSLDKNVAVPEERFAGNSRKNTLYRAWWFAEYLKEPDRSNQYELLSLLSQSDLDLILDKSGFCGYAGIAPRIARVYLEGTETSKRSMDLFRSYMNRLGRTAVFVDFDSLSIVSQKSLFAKELAAAIAE